MASYAEMADLYRSDMQQRNRMEMCAREQGYIYCGDGRPDIAALGRGVIGGDLGDIDAVIAAVCVQNTAGDIQKDDDVLLSAVQTVWPTVAAARYPQAPT